MVCEIGLSIQDHLSLYTLSWRKNQWNIYTYTDTNTVEQMVDNRV